MTILTAVSPVYGILAEKQTKDETKSKGIRHHFVVKMILESLGHLG